MKFWSFFAPHRADLTRKAPVPQTSPVQEKSPKPPPGIYCRANVIKGLEKECKFCEDLLNNCNNGLRCIVVLKMSDSSIYTQGTIPLYKDDEENNFKAIWPLWYYLQEQFFTIMVEGRGVEKFVFIDLNLLNEFSKVPQLIDIVDLFSLASVKPAARP